MPTACEDVVLSGGVMAPLRVLRLLWSLEERGVALRLAADGAVRVSPRGHLSEGERAFIRQHRDAVVRLVQYQAPTCA